MNYEKLDRHGEGANAVVFRAVHRATRRMVALKVFKLREDDPQFAERVQDECTRHAKLVHPNIVKVYDAGEQPDGRPFIAMELFEKGSLATRLGHEQMRNPETVARFIAKASRGAAVAHEHGIVHRDLKPANILIDEQGDPHITDFGVAKMLGLDGADEAVAIGTVPYMAPEQCGYQRDGECKIERWTDVYALGLLLYEMVSGKRPYAKSGNVTRATEAPPDDEVEYRRRLFEANTMPCPLSKLDEPRFARGRRPDRDLDRIIDGALAIHRFDRYSSAGALALDLERWVAGEPTHGPQQSPVQRAASALRSHALVLGLLLGLLTYLIGMISLGEQLIAGEVKARLQTATVVAELTSRNVLSATDTAKQLVIALARHSFGIEVLRAASPPPTAAEAEPESWVATMTELRRVHADQFYLLDRNGCILRYWPVPAPPGVFENVYCWRHYFECAVQLGPRGDACVSRVYKSEYDHNSDVVGTLRTAISAPVYDPDSKALLGVMVAAWQADRPFGNLPLGRWDPAPIETSLLFFRDLERSDAAPQLHGLTLPVCSANPQARAPADVALADIFQRLRREPKVLVFPSSGLKNEKYLSADQVAELAETDSLEHYSDPRARVEHFASFSSGVMRAVRAARAGQKGESMTGVVAGMPRDSLDPLARTIRASYAIQVVFSLVIAALFVLTRSRGNRRS